MGKRQRKPKTATPAKALTGPSRVKLYRVMSEVEFQRTMRTGRFTTVPGSLEAKWFAEKPEDAASWGAWFERASGIAHRRIVEVEVDEVVARRFVRFERLDDIGAARCATLVELRGATVREYSGGQP